MAESINNEQCQHQAAFALFAGYFIAVGIKIRH